MSIRLKKQWSVGFMLMMALFLAACGTPDPEPLILGEPVWQDGERSVYQVVNRDEQRIGDTIFTIDAGGMEEAAWTIGREINDIGINETVAVAVDDSGYRPLRSTTVRVDENGSQIIQADYQRARVDIELTNRQGNTIAERVNPPSDVRDERTLLPLIRTLPLAEGYATAINSFLPVTGQTTRYIVWVVRGESVTVPAGTFETWHVNLRDPSNVTSELWISQTAPYPVVRYVDGGAKAIFELSSFAPGGE